MGFSSGLKHMTQEPSLAARHLTILHLVGATEDNGGILSVIRNLASVSGRLGWNHVTWVREGYKETRRPHLAYLHSRHLWNEHVNHAALFWGGFRACFELRDLLRRQRFDVIHAHSRGGFVTAFLACAMLKRNVLFTNHAYARRTGLYRYATRFSRFHTTVLTPNMARHYGLERSQSSVSVISECCSDECFSGPLSRGGRSEEIRMVGLGNVLPWKKWDLVVEAMGLMTPEERSRFSVEIYGPTPDMDEARRYRSGLEERIRACGLGDRFRLMGSTSEVGKVLDGADWFVLPSTNEPCSVALIEALAAGVPGLVSSSGGNVDIIEEGRTGLLFKPDDVADLKRRMLEAVARRSGMVEAGVIRQSVRHRSATSVLEQFEPLYRRVAGG